MSIRPALKSDMDEIVSLLHTHMNPKISPERWRGLFSYSWLDHIPDYGRVAIAGGRIAGYLGAVYSNRIIEGETVHIVNPNSWYMEKQARREGKGLAGGLGLEMLYDLTSNPDQHYHTNTSSRLTVTLFRRAGFKVLDSEKHVWQKGAAADTAGLEVLTDTDAITARASTVQRKIIADHDGLPVAPMLIYNTDAQLFLMIATSRKGNDDTWLDIMHASDPALLGRWGQAIANIKLTHPSMRLSADSRFCLSQPTGANHQQIDVPRYFKTTGLPARHFDHLYGEIQLLKLKLS